MKIFVYLIVLISTVYAASYDRSVCTGDPPYQTIGNIIGDLFLGSASSAQKNMENTADPCYVAANEVRVELIPILDNFDVGTLLNKI